MNTGVAFKKRSRLCAFQLNPAMNEKNPYTTNSVDHWDFKIEKKGIRKIRNMDCQATQTTYSYWRQAIKNYDLDREEKRHKAQLIVQWLILVTLVSTLIVTCL